jgi:hypothetical protein
MGYRSTMILGVAPKYKKEFDKINKKHSHSDDLFKPVKGNGQREIGIDEMLIYEGEHLKWYDEFDDVKDIEELINKASEDNDNAFLVGIGEDGVIHSEIGLYYDYVGISTIHEIY